MLDRIDNELDVTLENTKQVWQNSCYNMIIFCYFEIKEKLMQKWALFAFFFSQGTQELVDAENYQKQMSKSLKYVAILVAIVTLEACLFIIKHTN